MSARPKNCYAIIPARSGSKRIPGKNIKAFAGRPMIEYAIETAAKSDLFDEILVSTDSQEVQEIAIAAGASAPFLRPEALSDDLTTTSAVLVHALNALGLANSGGIACCIYSTTPFVLPQDLHDGLKILASTGAASVFAAAEFAAPVHRAFRQSKDGVLNLMWPEYRDTRTQDLPRAFHDAGQFYWVEIENFLKNPALLTPTSRAVEIPRWRAHDLDTPDDWRRAELVFTALREDFTL